MSLAPGTVVADRYVIQTVLGSGATAVVYRALDSRLRVQIALKVLLPPPGTTQDFEARLRREAQTLARLNHPNILRLYDIGADVEHAPLFLVVEYLRGATLKERMTSLPWPLTPVLPLLESLASALDYAHTQVPAVVHRDLKPTNIMFGDDGRPVVCDFGLVRLMEPPRAVLPDRSILPTAVGLVVGTPMYMAPEQALGEDVGPASDRYSLAVVAYELLVGVVPFHGNTPLSTLVRLATEPLPRPSRLNPAITPAVEDVLLKGLARSPAERFASAGAFVDALASAAEPRSTIHASVPPRASPPLASSADADADATFRPSSRPKVAPNVRRVSLAGALVLVIALLLGGIGRMTRDDTSSARVPAPTLAPGSLTTPPYLGLWINADLGPGVHTTSLWLHAEAARALDPVARRHLQDVQAFIRSQIDRTASTLPDDRFPVRTQPDGTWLTEATGVWIAGHWAGMLWEAYRQTNDAKYLVRALQATDAIGGGSADDATGQDHGYLFGLSHVKALEFVSDDPRRSMYRTRALVAARTYASKVNPKNGLVSAAGTYADNQNKPADVAALSSIMNVPLLFWASDQSGDPEFARLALAHVDKLRQYAIRPDFSTAPTVAFDPRTGVISGPRPFDGYADGATWSRGQAFGLYGFAVVYAKTGDHTYRDTARHLADYYLAHLPSDAVPYWVFEPPPGTAAAPDSSAAAVAASGLQILALFEDDESRARAYLRQSINILNTLSSSAYLARGTSSFAVLLHATQDYPSGTSDIGLVLGDYYFMEAIERLLSM